MRSFIRQTTQMRPSDTYDDTLTMANSESSAEHMEDDLNYLRTQEKVITGMPNWYDPPQDSFNLLAIHDKLFTYQKQKMDDVAIPAAQTYVELTGATKPSGNMAIGASILGVITAQLTEASQTLDAAAATDDGGGLVGIPLTGHGYSAGDSILISGTTNYDGTYVLDASTSVNSMVITETYAAETFAGTETAQRMIDIGSNDLTMISDKSNVLEIRDADTNLPIFTSEISGQEHQIYGLLQVGSEATDGNTFGDSGDDQAQISFIYFDPATEAAVAAPVTAIESMSIEYAFRVQSDFYSLPKNVFDAQITFVDAIGVEIIDLQDAYDNGDGSILLSASKDLKFDLNSNGDVTIVDGAGNVLSTDRATGVINSGYDLMLQNQQELRFGELTTNGTDYVGFKSPADLSDTTTVYTLPGADGNADDVLMTDGSTVLSWDNPMKNCKKMTLIYTGAPAIASDTSIVLTGGAGWTVINPDSLALGASGAFFAKDYDVYLNGQLQLSGADNAANHDCYYVDSANLAFEFNITNEDIITIIQRKKSN